MKKFVLFASCVLILTMIIPCSYAQNGGMMGGKQGQMMGPEKSQKSRVEGIGEKIFNEECSSCHPEGGNVIVPALPLRGSRILANFRAFLAFIRHPEMPDGSQGSMPSFPKSKISDWRARELYHYIRSVEEYAAPGGYGMGPGMMRGYGMGRGMMGGYGMGPGMMRGYGMGPGMMGGYGMGPGFYGLSGECQKFYDDTVKLRKELHDKRFEYFEAVRNPKTTVGNLTDLQEEMKELQEKIYSKAPLGCQW
jgi:hypothetical protein